MDQLLKVLIADDEPNSREGIRDSLDWSTLGMKVVAEANDGEEALELALKLEVDIVLADLNMPIMDGLTLIKLLKDQLPACRVVIISGYDEFSYAQEAVRLQVEDYILKPIIPESLSEVLTKIRNTIQTQTAQTRFLELASHQISQNTLILQEQFCRDWIAGKLTNEKILEHLHFWGLPEEGPQRLTIIRSQNIDYTQPLIQGTKQESQQWEIQNIVLEALKKHDKLVFYTSSGFLVVLVWGNVEQDVIVEIEMQIQSFLQVPHTVYSETISGDVDVIPAAYERCKRKVVEESQISPIVRRAKSFIHQQYTDPELTLETIAQQLQVSTVYLSRIIKQELGTSFTGLVTELRMRKAIELLQSTNLQIYEIAEQVGYESQHYFSTAFKKVVGVSPNQFRKGALLQ
ncbi:response regulator transcription factor [Bacillus nitroreducens]